LTTYNVVNAASLAAGLPEDISIVLANFNAIAAVLNGNIDNGNINAAAAIAASKLAGYPSDGTKALLGDGTWGAAGLTVVTALPGSPTNGQQVALTDSLTIPTYMWPLRYNSTLTKWLPFGEGWGFGTSLPSVPATVDQVMFILTDSGAAPTYIWRFQYNGSNGTGYKWEFVGGSSPKIEIANAGEATSSGSYVDLTTVGPSFTVPRAGIYEISFSFNWWGANCPGGACVKLGAAAAAVTEGASSGAGESGAGAGNNITSSSRLGTSKTFTRTLAASDVLKMQYRATAGLNTTFSDRVLLVKPVRVT
jgi:hypothetical protein